MGSIVGAVADVFGLGPSSKQARATTQAADTSAAASRYATDVQREMFEKQMALQEPWRQAGQTALNALIPLSTQYTPFGTQQFQQDPGYAFRLSEGQKALDRQAAARGGLISGAALKAAQRYGQEMGSQEYQNAFNRYQAERSARLNPLQSLAGVGQTAANTLGSAASQYGSNVGNLAMTNAANQGNALLAGANIRASQYGTAGRALDEALNTDWSKVGNTLGKWFGNDYGGSGSYTDSAVYTGAPSSPSTYLYDDPMALWK